MAQPELAPERTDDPGTTAEYEMIGKGDTQREQRRT